MRTVYVLVVVLIISFIVYFSVKYLAVTNISIHPQGKHAIQSPTPIITRPVPFPTQDPLQVTQSFYSNYTSCLINPPTVATGQVSLYCQENTGLTTANFSQNLHVGGVAQRGSDPIMCSQNLPQKIDVIAIREDTRVTAIATISESFIDKTQIKSSVMLQVEGNRWKVSNIVCSPL